MGKEIKLREDVRIQYTTVDRPGRNAIRNGRRSCPSCSIDVYMIPAKAAYIFKLAIYDKLLFSMLYYLSLGLTPVQGGLVNGLQHIGGLVGAPLIGVIADKTQKYKLIAVVCCALAVIVNGLQPVFSVLYGTNKEKLFYTLLVTAIAASSVENGAISLVDSGVLQRMKSADTVTHYGLQRLFGAIGGPMGSISDSLAITYFPSTSLSPYTGVFLVYAVYGTCLLVTTYFLFSGVRITMDTSTQTSSREVTGLIIRALTSFDTIFFLTGVLLNGVMQALLYSFTYVYMKEFNAPTMVFGLGITVAGVSAIAVYTVQPWLMDKLGSPEKASCVAWFAMGIRMFGIAYLCRLNPYLFIIPELLQGSTYSLFWLSSVEYIDRNSHPSILTSMCGIVNSLYTPCSFLLGNILGAKLYDLYGGLNVFVGSGLFCFAWALISAVYIFVKNRRYSSYEQI